MDVTWKESKSYAWNSIFNKKNLIKDQIISKASHKKYRINLIPE